MKQCPRCESVLIWRTNSRTGKEFLGCSAYPGCDYTLSVVECDDDDDPPDGNLSLEAPPSWAYDYHSDEM